MKNLTEGRPLPLLLRFALPLVLGNLFQQAYNIVDSVIVGRALGTNALAGVGATACVQLMVLGFCIGCTSGFGIPVARVFGASDMRRVRDCVFHGGVLAAVIAILLTTLCVTLCHPILRLLSIAPEIYNEAYSYLIVIFLGLPFTLLYNLLSSILRSLGDSRTPFMFLVFSTFLNIALDLIAILVFGLGCAGAALATVAAQAVSGILCLVYILRSYPTLRLTAENREFKGDLAGHMLAMGIPMGLQFSLISIGSMVMQASNNALGAVYTAGFTLGNRIKQFVMCPFEAMGAAVATFCSQNLGAGKPDRIKAGIRDGLVISFLYGLFAGAVLIFLGRTLAGIFVSGDAEAALEAGTRYMACMGTCFWVLGSIYVPRMTTQGLGHTGLAIFSGVMETIGRSAVALALTPRLGFSAICWTDQAAWFLATMYILPVCLIITRKLCGTAQKQA